MDKCKKCEEKAIMSGFCKNHFVNYFEAKVKKTIRRFKLINKDEKIAIALSGGKDSTTLTYVLKKLGYNIEAVTVNPDIEKFSDKNTINLKFFCDKYKIPLHELSFKEVYKLNVQEIIKKTGKQYSPCTICGILRRDMLNRYTKKHKFDALATGHNLDDEVHSFLMNIFRNDPVRAIRMGPITGNFRTKKFTKRIKPLYMHSEEEIKNDPTVMIPRRKRVTVLFCDIRGFTAMSEEKPPEKIAELLNDHYFTPLGEIAYRHNGTVDKHMGDCMMVIYGSPVSHTDDAVRAVRSAIDMQQAVRSVSEKLGRANGFKLTVGIGISTGDVVTGVFGSLRKREFTAFGMAVNISARLEKMAGAGEILVSEATYREVPEEFTVEKIIPDMRVKGLKEPIPIYRVTGFA